MKCSSCGSILQYAFDEAGAKKSVVLFDLDKSGASNVREVPLMRGKQLVRLAAASVEEGVELIRKYPECYIELTLFLAEPLISSQVHQLKEANGGLISIIPSIQGGEIARAEVSRKQMSASELFREYYKTPKGKIQYFFSFYVNFGNIFVFL